MKNEYSKSLNIVLKKKREFDNATFEYNNYIEDSIKKQDLKKILNGNDCWLIRTVLEMIIREDLFPDIIDLVLDEIVYIAITGKQEWVVLAIQILSNLDKNIYEKKIVDLAFSYIEENKRDEIVFFFGFNLFYSLKNKDVLLKFINKYLEGIKNNFDLGDIKEYLEELE